MKRQFLYGSSTSSHQVEGNNVHNDWWKWELKRNERFRSGRAADHYRLFEQDFQLAKDLGHNAHRFSIEWSRIEPKRGVYDKREIEHYRRVLLALRDKGLVPMATLWHFTLPQWLVERGGWSSSEAVDRFARLAGVVMDNLGDLAEMWLTLNEPMVYAEQAYWHGKWPPEKRNGVLMWRAINNLAKAHNAAYRVMKRKRPWIKVGIAKNFISYVPDRESSLMERVGVEARDWWFNQRFFALTDKRHDFIGVNYYFQNTIAVRGSWPRVKEWEGERTDLGWPIRPDGLRRVLIEVGKRYQLPLYVTENGLADAEDKLRGDFIRSHLKAVEEAQKAGADVRGYFHWSLLDNFEWAEGFEPRFGLVEVDYATMERRIRPSAYVYKAIIER